MSELENKIKETAGQAAEVARTAAQGVKEEAKAFAADTKGYSAEALETVKNEGKEVVEEIKAAVTGQKLESASTEGAAGYRAKGGAPTVLEITAIVLGVFSILLRGLFGLIVGVVATVVGAKARSDSQTTVATIGFGLGAIGAIIGLITLLF